MAKKTTIVTVENDDGTVTETKTITETKTTKPKGNEKEPKRRKRFDPSGGQLGHPMDY